MYEQLQIGQRMTLSVPSGFDVTYIIYTHLYDIRMRKTADAQAD